MSEKKETEDCPSEEASSQAESYDANKSGTETYDLKDFCPGIRIEAKDFDGKWYPAKVSDVDWTENEILVHFENWNTKFDEWIPMDSSRLRPLQKPPLQQKDHTKSIKFAKGEEVMAMWSPYQKYPATIQAVLANDRYDVLFYDGFLKRLKSHKISKLEGEIVKTEVRNFTDIGTKEERRERKRKINVAELFHINKRSRKKGLVHSKSQDIKTYPVSKSRNKSALIKKIISNEKANEHITNVEVSELKEKENKMSSVNSSTSKALVDTIPAAFEVKYINGQTEMWSKQLYQRSEGRTAGKLDIVILNPQGRKFRSRNEIMKYCEESGIVYSHEAFDFSAKGRPKSKSTIQTPPTKLETSIEEKDKSLSKRGQRKSQFDIAVTPQDISPALINQAELLSNGGSENKVFIGDLEVVIENGKFICPVKICAKHFRRENLLHMHMKHYHPEFSKYLDYTPSVTDLAYARTVGGLDGVDATSPAPRKPSDKPSSKADNVRKSSDISLEYPKEAKKIKLDTKPENKSHPIKGFREMPATSQVSVLDNSNEESQKSKACFSNLLIKKTSNSNENDVMASDKICRSSENKSAEQVMSESKNTLSTHSTVLKSLRHHRLHSRKKPSRFQGSFVEHMRKKRLISQDHSRSQNKLGKQSHLRQTLQEVAPIQTTVPTQSCVDANSNTSSQIQAFTRYQKPHMNITNEMSGKNYLLTSCKTLSPVTEKINQEKNNDFGQNDVTSMIESESSFKVNKDENQISRKAKTIKQYSRRRFITGLINARKRRENSSCCRIRKKKRKKKLRNVEPPSFHGEVKPSDSGLAQGAPKPDANVENNKINFDETGTELVDKNDTSHEIIKSEINNVKLDVEKQYFHKKIMIKIKRIDDDDAKVINNSSSDGKRDLNGAFSSNYSVTRDNFFIMNGCIGDEKFSEILREKNSKSDCSNYNYKTEIEDKTEDLDRNTENEGVQRLEPETNTKHEIDPKELPKSRVVLENIYRKDKSYVDCLKEDYDENGSCLTKGRNKSGSASKSFNAKKAVKRGNRFSKSKSGQKRVRFENMVMEKWINVDEVEDANQSRSITYENDAKIGESKREERKRRLTKGQSLDSVNENEMNRAKGLDDSSTDENSQLHDKAGLDQTEGTEDSKAGLVVENDKVEKLRRNEIINCVCGITEEDGLMIQCDLCLCWQHGHCAGIFRESDVPDKYTCAICKNPYRARASMKYLHDQEWLKEGTLPSLSFRSKREDVINQRKTILKRSHDLSGSIALLARVIHSLRLKVNIAEKKDHPKLWLWAKKWTEKKPNRLKEESVVKEEKLEVTSDTNTGAVKEEALTEDEKQLPKAPEPEAPIDSAECRINLLDHLIHYQTLIDARLSCIESLVAELESMQDDAVNDETPDRYPRTKATVQMLLRDLNTMKKIAII